jgi:hypothetical protein
MPSDPITEEIRSIRHELAAQFGNDVSRIFADVRQREAADGRTYVTLPRRPAHTEARPGTNGGPTTAGRRERS